MADEIAITSREELEVWLKDKPADWASVIALRSALRVFPLAFTILDISDADLDHGQKQGLIQQTWRAMFISSVAALGPTDEMRRAAADAAAYAARSDAAAAAAWGAVTTECRLLEEAPDEDESVRRLLSTPLWIEPLPESRTYATNAPEITRNAFDAFANRDWVRGSAWELITDWYAAILPNGRDRQPRNIFDNPLGRELATQSDEFWTVGDDRSPDDIMGEAAEILGWKPGEPKQSKPSLPTISEVILTHLNSVNRPASTGEIVSAVADAGLDVKEKSVWDTLSRLAAAWRIERVGRALYRGIKAEDGDAQPPAPYNFAFVNYEFALAKPDPDLTVSTEYRDDMWAALRDALRRQAGAARATNAFIADTLSNTLEGLSGALGESPTSLRPGVLQSHWRLLARQMARLATNGGTGSDQLDDVLDDIADALEDLRGCYQDIRRQEVEMVRLGVTARNVGDVVNLLRQMADVLQAADPAVLPEAVRQALAHNLPMIDSAEDEETRADIAADQVLTDQAFGIVLRKAIADFGRASLKVGREDLVNFTGRLPRRAVQASLALIGLNYLGVLDQLAVHIPNLRPLLSRFRKLQEEGDLNVEPDEDESAPETEE